MKKNRLLFFYSVLLYLFLYLPIFLVVLFSFNESPSQSVFTHFSLKWYKTLLENERVLTAAKNSFLVALFSAILATILGTLLAIGFWRYQFRGKGILEMLLFVPVVLPEVVLGVSLLILFAFLSIRLSLFTVVLAHVTFSLPYTALVVRSSLQEYDVSLEDAARDLGATPWQIFLKITIPILMPGILAGTLLAVTLSLDDVVVSFFVSGVRGMTLPVKIFSMVRAGVKPDINALSSLMILGTFFLAFLAYRVQFWKKN